MPDIPYFNAVHTDCDWVEQGQWLATFPIVWGEFDAQDSHAVGARSRETIGLRSVYCRNEVTTLGTQHEIIERLKASRPFDIYSVCEITHDRLTLSLMDKARPTYIANPASILQPLQAIEF
jgi:hypothetical protein